MPLDGFTIVKWKDGRLSYIKEWFVQSDIEGKETIEVTSVYLVYMPGPIISLNDIIAFEDEKKTLKIADLLGMKRIQSDLSE
jgi:hypothetical protein